MNDQPTPETNAFFATFADGECEPSHAEYYFRMQDLERERDFERKLNTQIMEGNTRITKERDKALRDVEKAKSCKKALKNENNKLRRERDEAQRRLRKAQVENDHNWQAMELYEAERVLADKLADIADGTGCRECGGEDQARLAREALAAWKEVRSES